VLLLWKNTLIKILFHKKERIRKKEKLKFEKKRQVIIIKTIIIIQFF